MSARLLVVSNFCGRIIKNPKFESGLKYDGIFNEQHILFSNMIIREFCSKRNEESFITQIIAILVHRISMNHT